MTVRELRENLERVPNDQEVIVVLDSIEQPHFRIIGFSGKDSLWLFVEPTEAR